MKLIYHNLCYTAEGEWSYRQMPIPPSERVPWHPRQLDPATFLRVQYEECGEVATREEAVAMLGQSYKLQGLPEGARGALAYVTLCDPDMPRHRRNCVEIPVWVEVAE